MMYTFKFQDQTYKIKLEEEGRQTEVEISGTSGTDRQCSFTEKKIPLEFQKIDESFYSIIVDGRSIGAGILKKGKKVEVFVGGDLYEFESISEREREISKGVISGVQEIKSPIEGKVKEVKVKEGDAVESGTVLVLISSE